MYLWDSHRMFMTEEVKEFESISGNVFKIAIWFWVTEFVVYRITCGGGREGIFLIAMYISLFKVLLHLILFLACYF